MKANYHTHSVFCDGSDTPEDIVRCAISKGFTHLGFSGHMDPDIHMCWDAYYREISRLKEKYDQIDLLCGVELDTIYDPDCIRGEDGQIQAEYIIGSTHYVDIPVRIPRMTVDNTPEILQELCETFFGGDYYALSSAYYALEQTVYDRTHCTFIGHFDLITRFNDQMHFLDETDPRYLKSALETMEYLVQKDIPFEINSGAVNRGRKKEMYPSMPLLKALHDFGGEIVINSDAHQKELLDGCLREAAQCAIACGFTHTNILEHTGSGKVAFRQVPLDLY